MNRFCVAVLAQTPLPQTVIYAAMHQDYSEGFVWDERDRFPDEQKCGEVVVKRLLAGERGHYGPLEHPQIVLNVGYFPHSVMQQARTHRVGISFDVQSSRYTGLRFQRVAKGEIPVDEAFYLRPVGDYYDRFGKKYHYSETQRQQDLDWCKLAAERYQFNLEQGMSEEHARGILPFDYRQHFVVSLNVRSLMHFLDLRAKKDAQLEIQKLCDLIWPHFQAWVPEIAAWYESSRLAKARLSP